MKKIEGKILKVIYYDENAAMDYVTIVNDGNITVEEINKAITGSDAEVKVEGEAAVKTSLLKMLKLSLGIPSFRRAASSALADFSISLPVSVSVNSFTTITLLSSTAVMKSLLLLPK